MMQLKIDINNQLLPVITLSTPPGSPISSAILANSKQVTEAYSEGFKTAQQPAARQGATFH